MTAIKLTAFGGEQPKIVPRLLPPTFAQAAFNARLDDGGLTPVRRSVLVTNLPDAARMTIYKHGDEWLSWTGHVHAAPGPVAEDRLYYTGDGVPKMLAGGNVYDLALAPPAGALTATIGGTGSGDPITRVYVYTWVTDFGEESEPSPASAPVVWQPGNTMTVSGFAATPPGRNITTQRIYRSQTGQLGTYLYLIAERAASTSDFVDNVAVDAFQEPLPSADWNPPPDDLEGLTVMPNGIMAGFVGKDLYFCEPWRPHAWPEKYVQTTSSPIVGLGAIGTMLVVMTEGNPEFANGSHPESMRMVKAEDNFPCVNARGIVDLGFAICYPSVEGLVAVRGDGSINLASNELFGRYEWQALSPSTLVAGQYGGRYLAFYDTEDADGGAVEGALFIDVGPDPFLVRSRQLAQACFYDVKEAALYFVPVASSTVRRFDAPNAVREEVYWRSKQFVMPVPMNFGAIKVDSDDALSPEESENLSQEIAAAIAANAAAIAALTVDGDLNSLPLNEVPFAGDTLQQIPASTGLVQVGIWADKVKVASISATNRPKRLPGGFKAEIWEIDVATTARVTNIVMGETMDDLKQVS